LKTDAFESIFRIVGTTDSPEDFKFLEFWFKKKFLKWKGVRK